MREFIRRSGAALGLLLTGIVVEFVLAFAKDEPVSFQRFGTLLGFIALLMISLELAEKRHITWRRMVATGLIIVGALGAAAGVFILFEPTIAPNPTVANIVGTTVLSCGMIVVVSGIYVIMQRGVVQRDDPGEYPDRSGLTQPISGTALNAMLTTFDGDVSQSAVQLFKEKMTLYDLHFIAYYVDGKCRFYTDVLDADGLHDMKREVAAEPRRKRYEAYGRLTHGFVGRLDNTFQDVDQGDLIRVVLDVEHGAFYYIKLDKRRFVFAVTLNQHAVNVADDKIRQIALTLEDASGGMPENKGLNPDRPQENRAATNVIPLTKHKPLTREKFA